ncbi:hypothetical protein [Methanomethylovorans sp.]
MKIVYRSHVRILIALWVRLKKGRMSAWKEGDRLTPSREVFGIFVPYG